MMVMVTKVLVMVSLADGGGNSGDGERASKISIRRASNRKIRVICTFSEIPLKKKLM